MICDVCGKEGAVVKRVSRAYGEGDDVVVVDRVPVVMCPHCGERYMTAETMHELERLRAQRGNAPIDRQAPVITYG